jgi:hypothetical protein
MVKKIKTGGKGEKGKRRRGKGAQAELGQKMLIPKQELGNERKRSKDTRDMPEKGTSMERHGGITLFPFSPFSLFPPNLFQPDGC